MTPEWLNAIGVLLSGAIIGFMFFYVSMQKKNAKAAKSPELIDLEAKRDALIAKLKEIDEVGGTTEERARLEGEAADVLRQLDIWSAAAKPPLSKQQEPTPTQSGGSAAAVQNAGGGAMRGFLWGIGSAAVVAGLVIFVFNQSKARGAGEPASGGSGMQPATAQMQQQEQPDDELRTLEAAVQQKPDDVAVRDKLVKAYMDREKFDAAFEQASAVLQRAPNDAPALTYQAIVRIAMGETELASKQLELATTSDPKLTQAWVALAWSYLQTGRGEQAAKAIDSAVKERPEEATHLRTAFEKMKAESAQKAQGAAPHPVMPAANADNANANPSANASGAVHITLKMAGGVAVPPSGVIFIIARDGKSVGPPSAVKRIELGAFPISVDLTGADSMMGQPLPSSMRIEVRIDTDGNAMTHEPGAPSASKDGVAAGDSVTLTLK
jgi:tetratricopeptide (TPR) repeat protein